MAELNFKLHAAQMQIFKSMKRFIIVAAGRRFGKSYLSAIKLLIEGLMNENEYGYNLSNKEVYYVAPTFEQGKRIMWNLLKELGRDVISTTHENTATLTLVNGRRISIKGSDRPDTLRGVGLSFVVMDEYAFMKPEVWELIIRPTLSDVRGKAMFIGTPDGKNHFYDLFVDAMANDEEWDAFSFTSRENTTISPEEIEYAKNTLSSDAFRQEFEASFSSFGGKLLKEDWIEYGPEPMDDGFFYVSVDPAGYEAAQSEVKSRIKRLDEMAISVVKVSSSGWWVKEIKTGRWDVREASLQILKAAKGCHATAVGIEQGSLKNAIMPYLEDQSRRLGIFPHYVEVKHGGRKKSERILWALQGRFEHGRITLNKGEWNKKFIEQYLDFPNPMSHDDMLDSLAYIDQIATTSYASFLDVEEWEPLDVQAGY